MSEADGRECRAAARWLATACRRFLAGESAEGSEPLSVDLEPAVVGRLAAAHGIEPLLHSLVAEGGIEVASVPDELAEAWLAAYCWTQLTNRRRLASLAEAFERCRTGGLDLVALKGPVHVARVYGDPGLRPMVDLDLLCRRGQLEGVVEALRAAGYEPSRVTSVFHLALRHRERGDLMELHFDLYELIAGRQAFLEELWSSAAPCEVGDAVLRAASPEHAVVVDLAHLINHDLRIGLRQAVDLCGQLLPGRSAGPDRERLGTLLDRADLRVEAGVVVGVLERLLGWPTGSLGVAGSPPPGLVEQMAPQVASTWARLDELSAPPALHELSYRPGIGSKLAYLRRLLAPGEASRGLGGPRARRHLGGLMRSAWRKLGGASALWRRGAVSLKREVYRRR